MSQTVFAEKEDGVRFSFWLEGDEKTDYHLAAFKAEEALFSLTKIEILLKISASSFGFAERLGKKATLTIAAEGLAKPAYLSGVVAEASEFFEAGEALTRLVLLPNLAELEKEPRYRVFQELAIPDIVETLLCEHGIADALWQLEGNFAPRRFCMQYGETDLAFMHRILAEEGIFYYFVHEEKGSQRLVLCNNIHLLLDCPNGGLKHDSHDSHGLYDIAGAAEVYCHSLRRTRCALPASGSVFAAGKPAAARAAAAANPSGRHSAALFALPGGRADGSTLRGIVHLPLPLCGHKAALACPFDKSLNGIWALIAVRHEGMDAESGLLSHNLADYFDENLQGVMRGFAEKAASGGAFGRAFSATSLLPRLMQANGGSVYDFADSPYGVPYKGGSAHNVVSMAGKNISGKNKEQKAPSGRKAVYACAFTALDSKAVYHPPEAASPVIAGPQEARLIGADKAANRYRLELRINESGAAAENLRFWAYGDTELGEAAAELAAAAGADKLADAEIALKTEKFLIGFLGGNPDKPIALAHSLLQADKRRGQNGAAAAKRAADSAPPDAEFDETALEEQVKNALSSLPWEKTDARRLNYRRLNGGRPIEPPQAGVPQAGHEQGNFAAGYSFIHVGAKTYNAFNDFSAGAAVRQNGCRPEQSKLTNGRPSGQRHNAIPLAQIQADLHSGTAPSAVNYKMAAFAPAAAEPPAEGSRFLQVPEHQREDINGIYELNCGEKYLCRSRNLHLSASDRLILRGPGGKIIIDKHSMILEAPLIRLKGRLAVEEDMFDRQEGVKIAIRDELPLVADCGAGGEEGEAAEFYAEAADINKKQ